MADINAIIVGGGLNAGGTFALGQTLYVTNVNPPQASTYGVKVVSDGAVTGITSIPNSSGTYNSISGATELLRVQGGIIVSGSGTDTVQIGRAASATGNQSTVVGTTATDGGQVGVVIGFGASFSASAGVVIGNGATVAGNAGGSTGIAIGTNASATNSSSGGGDSIAIGNSAVAKQQDTVFGFSASSSVQNLLGNANVVIGSQAAINVGQGQGVAIGASSAVAARFGVAIGQAATIGTGQNNVAIGQGAMVTGAAAACVVLGQGSTTSATQTIILGSGFANTTTNTCWIGAPNTDVQTLIIGSGDTNATVPARNIRFTNASGLNNAAGDCTLTPPLSTGSGTPARFIVKIGHVGGSSSTVQTANTMLIVDDAKMGFFGVAAVARQVSGGVLANVITGLVNLGLFSS